MYRIAKLLQELLRKEFGDGGDVRTGALVALEGRLIRAIEDEDWVDGERDEAEEAIVEGSQRRIRAAYSLLALLRHRMHYESSTFTSLYLEEPYGCVYSNAQRAAALFELLDGESGQGHARSGADLFVYTARISILIV
jgi:hypothetical protein